MFYENKRISVSLGNRNKERRVIFMTAIEILISVVCTIFGAFMLVSGIKTVTSCKSKTVGRITGIHKNEGIDNEGSRDYSYSPEYEYEVDGQRYHGIAGRDYSNPDRIKIGGNIDVYYNPEKPDEHYTKGGVKLGPLVGVGAIFFGVILILSNF